ncbi:hypothetical protein GCM10011502_14780 [Oceanisphaera marina]|uniref:Nicotinate-nucleotide--dimethylbenzimidazole phosphoribosyltransferase n=1 Tax=Oceanisphaera marina TaxID=2017550 RepID=A0ABQ1IKN0_9GAMM|nr:hypothetical protein GCM10011502_14780 [Oceanisphaera marina]
MPHHFIMPADFIVPVIATLANHSLSQRLHHKHTILARVLARHKDATAPFTALAALGGLEIAMMAGALIKAASQRRILLMDGFIAGVALLVAEQLAPDVCQFAVFAHHSAEPGHGHLLRLLHA